MRDNQGQIVYQNNSPEFQENYLNASEDELLASGIKDEYDNNYNYRHSNVNISGHLEDSSLMIPKQVFSQGTDLIYSG